MLIVPSLLKSPTMEEIDTPAQGLAEGEAALGLIVKLVVFIVILVPSN